VTTPLMADESLLTEEDAEQLLALRACQRWNVRVGKCGGLLASRDLLKTAADRGVGAWLGVMVGETGVLRAAGRTLAAHAPGLRHMESDGGMLLQHDVATSTPAPGLGVAIDEARVAAHLVRRTVVGARSGFVGSLGAFVGEKGSPSATSANMTDV
jgi:L-alanine-DL-glutamate epimerase-like enolase superfamily enzyme